jgi:DUF4097 and DUF4098 domain-containing protein YvlB
MQRPIVIALLIVALVLICAGIASVIFFAANGGFPTNNPFDVRNIPSQLEESKTLKVDAAKPVTLGVSSDAGDVTVTGADVETVTVKIVKTAYDSTQARADEEVKGIQYTITQNGNTINLKYSLPKSMNFNNWVNTVDFVVTVPSETQVTIDTNGDVTVSDIQGNSDLNTDFGSLSVENIKGSLSMNTNNGDIQAKSVDASGTDVKIDSSFGNVTVEQLTSRDLTVTSSNGTLTFTNVRATGDLYTKSSFGDITYENGSSASLQLESDNGKIKLTQFDVKQGLEIKNSFGDIRLTNVTASSYDLDDNNGDLTIDGVTGKLKAHTEFGDIEIINARSVILDLNTNNGSIEFNGSLGEGSHVIKSEFGAVDLTLPADVKLNVDLSTEFGQIKSDLPITVTVTESSGPNSNRDQIVGTINGGGDQLTVDTNNGGITIHAGK